MSTPAKSLLADFLNLEKLELRQDEYNFFAEKMYEYSGVFLPANDKNFALMKNRLAKLLRQYSFVSYQDLIQKLKVADARLINEFVSCLTTNKTDFFRESYHFEVMVQFIKEHFKSNSDLRVWCAAASTGQEPYTLSIVLNENLSPVQLSQSKILATDIDLAALGKAAEGFYSEPETNGLSPLQKQKYFNEIADHYHANPELTQILHFSQFNLIKDPYRFQKPFHLIFCRNVLIYFDEKTINYVIDQLLSCLVPGGLLFLGHSEAGVMKSPKAKSMTRAVFKKL